MKWFKHASDASDDSFIEGLEEKFGWEGYGRWWKLLEIIAREMEKNDLPFAEHTWVKWQSLLKGKRKNIELFLAHCVAQNKLIISGSFSLQTGNKLETNSVVADCDRKQTENKLKITCNKLLDLRDNHTKKFPVTFQELPPKTKIEEKESKKELSSPLPPSEPVDNSEGMMIDDFEKSNSGTEPEPEPPPPRPTYHQTEFHPRFAEVCKYITDRLPKLNRKGATEVNRWLIEGVDPPDIYETVNYCISVSSQPIYSFNYFTDAVMSTVRLKKELAEQQERMRKKYEKSE